MTILSALTRLYDRMEADGTAAPPGFSTEKISFSLVIDADGRPIRLADKRSMLGKKPAPVPIRVPAAVKRASGIKPNLFWDKSAYVLGITMVEVVGEDGATTLTAGQAKRTADEHAAFVAAHLELLAGTNDPGLLALAAFLQNWQPEMYNDLHGDILGALDQNLVFEFEDQTGPHFIHDRRAAQHFLRPAGDGPEAMCLVTGEHSPVARLHPSIKGVMGAQSSGASLVSFNSDAYESLGKTQGANAPVSEHAAFAYGTALNTLLERKSDRALERKLRIGDTTVVFWVEAESGEQADQLEAFMGQAFNPPDEAALANQLAAALRNVAEGRATDGPALAAETQVYILGLAPNAARLSVRFWYPGQFGDFARHVVQFWDDLQIEPARWRGPIAPWALLYETALQGKAENIPPLLGGTLMRAVLTGQPLPRTLLTAVIGRIRADGVINDRRAAICKAVVNRLDPKENIPVSLDPESRNQAYCLGRLFASYTYAEHSYAKRSATLRDKYLAGASSNPGRVFPLLMRGYEHNRSALLKANDQRRGGGVKADKAVSAIVEMLDGASDLPGALSMDEQAKFFVGFYHQWTAFFEKPEAAAEAAAEDNADDDAEEIQ